MFLQPTIIVKGREQNSPSYSLAGRREPQWVAPAMRSHRRGTVRAAKHERERQADGQYFWVRGDDMHKFYYYFYLLRR